MNNSVLIICTSLNMGGSEKQAVWLANKLIEENKKVYFVSLKDAGILSTELSPKISVNNFKLRNAKNPLTKFLYFCLGVVKLVRLTKSKKITTTITFLFHSNVVGKLLKIISREKILHIATFRSDRLSKRDSKISRFRTLIFKNFVLDKDIFVVFNSMSGLNNMNLKNVNTRVIFNTPLNNVQLSKDTKEQNTKLVFIGRFDELKNVENITLSMKYLLNEDVVLDIYGKGPDLTSIEQAISENNLQNKVKLKGIDKDIANKLSNYDALIIASTHDAFPNVLIEAMNAGVVPISTKVGDCEWLLSENRGIFINGFDPESISLSIKKFYEMDLNKKNEIIKNGRNLINQNLSEEKILKDWLEILF
mgnify:FL=1